MITPTREEEFYASIDWAEKDIKSRRVFSHHEIEKESENQKFFSMKVIWPNEALEERKSIYEYCASVGVITN